MCVVYLCLIILFMIDDVSVDSNTLFNRLCESLNQVDLVFQRYS
jgi:hypothetical protein